MTRSLLLALLFAAPAAAEEMVPKRDFPESTREVGRSDAPPLPVRWMIKPLRRGMFIRLPVLDTDPNRGVTVGVMPIAVLQGENDDRIRQIHAPSLSYNTNFGVQPTYRYYLYPKDDATLVLRGALSKFENELLGQYADASFLGTPADVFLRVQHNTDAGQRFFGFGPDSSRLNESNYREIMLMYRATAGYPLFGTKWRARGGSRFQASQFGDGPIPNLKGFRSTHPGQFSERRQQTHETRLALEYDSRDHGVTMSRGQFHQLAFDSSMRGFMSQYDYNRWTLDSRGYFPWAPGRVFALQAKLEQLTGAVPPPFWLQSRLGGKYGLRAYGEGRYVDRGMALVNAEQRFTVFEKKMAGVTTEFQAAPFVGAGTVFDEPGKAHRKFVRPVVGAAIRAVAKPQVVGSVDFGVGREGLSVFMDINYSF
jgi:hypothetical protein